LDAGIVEEHAENTECIPTIALRLLC